MFPRGVAGKVKEAGASRASHASRGPSGLGSRVSAEPPKGLCFRNQSAPWGERDREPRLLGA